MLERDTDVGRSALPRPIELKPTETKEVAGVVADLAIRHPPARWRSVGLAQLTLLEPVRGDLPTADRAVSAE